MACRTSGAKALAAPSPPPIGSESAFTERLLTQVPRSVSMGQLPSSRMEALMKSIARRVTRCRACPLAARLMATKLVKGVASRNPPLEG